ncbi:hypothetical protein [Actinomyces howellii]|uniref:hypothetical protein n=1 Tax=Actinomyces howellii TaxID=52771 RepID=UPI00137508C8|nr:hypothetical protein [Actinomyces howellii]
MSACTQAKGPEQAVTVTQVQSLPSGNHDSDLLHLLPTAGGSIDVVTDCDEETEVCSSAVVSRDAVDDSLQWVVELTPAVHLSSSCPPPTGLYGEYHLGMDFYLSEAFGPAVVSPDGRHIAMVTCPALELDDDGWYVTDQRSGIVVLDAASGRMVRTIEVSGYVLGQVLTNDALVVQTAQDVNPALEGTLTIAPLTDTSAAPTTLPADQWLVGSADGSVLLSPRRAANDCRLDPCGPMAVTRMSTEGTVLETIPGVERVYPGGWVKRFTDPSAAVDLAVEDSTKDREERDRNARAALGREVLDLDSGATVDVTGMDVEPTALPTGPGLLVSQPADDEGDPAATSTPVLWLSAADDGRPHTEGLEAFSR